MPETQAKEKVSRIVPMTTEEFIFLQLKDLKDEFRDSRKELNARMDRIEQRQDKLEAKLETTRKELNTRMDKQDVKIDKLADKIDELSKKIDSSMNQGQICLITTIGIAITVLYSIFSK